MVIIIKEKVYVCRDRKRKDMVRIIPFSQTLRKGSADSCIFLWMRERERERDALHVVGKCYIYVNCQLGSLSLQLK